MSELESRLSVALRREAEVISMSVDMGSAVRELDSRLDAAQARRRRWVVVAAVAAAALVVAGVWWGSGLVRAEKAHPVAPAPGTWVSTSGFPVHFTVSLPAWVEQAPTEHDVLGNGRFAFWTSTSVTRSCPGTQSSSEQTTCVGREDLEFYAMSPESYYSPSHLTDEVRITSYGQYVAYLESLAHYGMTVSDAQDTILGGHTATLLSVRPDSSYAPYFFGCAQYGSQYGSCFGFAAGITVRFAVVDDGAHGVVVLVQRMGTQRPLAELSSEFDAAAAHLTFG